MMHWNSTPFVRWVGVSVACGLLLATPVGPVTSGIVCDTLSLRVLEQSASRTIVQLSWDETDPRPRTASFAVALPSGEMPQVRVLDRQLAGPQPWDAVGERPSSLVRVDPPARFRGQWISPVVVHPIVNDPRTGLRRWSSVTVELAHPSPVARTPRPPEAEADAHLLEGLMVNPVAARAFREVPSPASRKRAVLDPFENGDRWLRIEIARTGVYRLDHSELNELVSADLIDPSSLRLLAAPLPYQPIAPQDPAGSWRLDYQLEEIPILVRAAGATLEAGDAVIFYAAGPEAWTDRWDPAAGPWDHVEHEYADHLTYWLTWQEAGAGDGGFGAPPLRMTGIDAAPTGSAAQVRTWHRARHHEEQNAVMLYGAVPDNWVWRRIVERGAPQAFSFDVNRLRSPQTANVTLYTHGIARANGSGNPRALVKFNNDPTLASFEWAFVTQESYSFAPVELLASGGRLAEGRNVLVFENDSPVNTAGDSHQLTFDFFAVQYDRNLVVESGGLEWVVFEEEVTADESWEFRVSGPATTFAGEVLVLDTTEPRVPRQLTGASVSGAADRVDFERAVRAGERHHFVVANAAALRTPAGLTVGRPRLLRAEVRGAGEGSELGYDLVVLADAEMLAAAQALADHRAQNLGDHPNPRTTAVDLQDVYDQFGHGVKEPAAIRNYLKFLYEADPRLEFAVLVGDASRDYRNRAGRDPRGPEIDRCPTFIQTQWPRNYTSFLVVPYAADDWFGCFDDPAPRSGASVFIDLPEVALGRLPAANAAEASFLVSRVLDYEENPSAGPWRNRVLMVADDEVGLAAARTDETEHILEAECLAEGLLPRAIDVDKLYLTEFAAVPGGRAKPKARERMRQQWSEGALVVHYIGHGSPEQMADEAVFRIEDVAGLSNQDRLPLFLAFSCDVAIFEDPVAKSMSEQLVLQPAGGALAAIAATQVTFITPNEDLTEAFYPLLYPEGPLDRSQPVGRALMQAKVIAPRNTTAFTQHNNQKYHLLGDPALRLQSPRQSVQVAGALSQAIQSGRRQDLQASIVEDEAVRTDLSGPYFLEAKESADSTVYVIERAGGFDLDLPYVLDGARFFEGSGAYQGGAFGTELLAPRFMRFGADGRVRVLMGAGTEMFVATREPLPVQQVSIVEQDEQGPLIRLSFANDASQVTPGSVLTAEFEDSSGINVLGTKQVNSILIELDDDGFPADVTDRFQLEVGKFTRGSLQYPLPLDTTPGRHVLVVTAADMLENVSRAQIDFDVISAGGIEIVGHGAFPNPFRTDTRFVLEVTGEQGWTAEIAVFTVDGRAVRRLSAGQASSGKALIAWDGRDTRGDVLANGVYLYRVKVAFDGLGVSEVATGRVVKME